VCYARPVLSCVKENYSLTSNWSSPETGPTFLLRLNVSLALYFVCCWFSIRGVRFHTSDRPYCLVVCQNHRLLISCHSPTPSVVPTSLQNQFDLKCKTWSSHNAWELRLLFINIYIYYVYIMILVYIYTLYIYIYIYIYLTPTESNDDKSLSVANSVWDL
jgi:hypothetical protein